MSLYEIAILGSPTPAEFAALSDTLTTAVAEFGLAVGDTVGLRSAATLADRNPRAPLAACFFATAAPAADELAAADEVMRVQAPIIPTIPPGGNFAMVPQALGAANGLRRRADDPGHLELTAALLECVGLLREQRRVFVSYRRTEARSAAVQLHDELSARGFDVFLDTHDIRPGAQFQDVLWHRLCDSDVMVMLDTPGYFDSRWTRQEIGRARAKEIQVLRVIWPGHTPTRLTDLADTIYLSPGDLTGPDGPLEATMASQVTLQVEDLRSRSLATRHRGMAGKLVIEAMRCGAEIEGVGAHRAIAVRLLSGARVWAYPVIGVPTAVQVQEITERSARAGQDGVPALVYDHVGLLPRYREHLAWLEARIADVKWIQITEAAWQLPGLEP